MTCRYSREARDYLTPDGEPCRRDDYGDPTHHCTARPSCSWHVGAGELTCGRCIAGVRRDLQWIAALAPLMMTQALADGIDSQAAMLAGPSADPEAWSWRKVAAKQGRAWHVSLVEEDDEHHPATVTGTWARMVAEDYGHDMPHAASLTWCVGYLDRQLHRIAHDDGQDFPLLRRELRKCRQHLEAVLHNDDRPDRGAPCPECREEGQVVRLVRHYTEGASTDRYDVWRCPRNREHEWGHGAYTAYLEERTVGA